MISLLSDGWLQQTGSRAFYFTSTGVITSEVQLKLCIYENDFDK